MSLENILKLCELDTGRDILLAFGSIADKSLAQSNLMFIRSNSILDRTGWNVDNINVWRFGSSSIAFISLSVPGHTSGRAADLLYIHEDCPDYMLVGLEKAVNVTSSIKFSCHSLEGFKVIGPIK